MNESDDLVSLAIFFASLSLIAFGGINTLLPEMHRQAVEVHGWLGDEQFTQLYAISQAAPGPNLMIVSLIGWQAAGVLGAVIATVAMVLPSSILAYVVTRTWVRFQEARWRKAVQAGMIPVTVGLVSASALVITTTVAGENWRLIAVTLVTAAIVGLTRTHPLLPLAAAGALGYAGVL